MLYFFIITIILLIFFGIYVFVTYNKLIKLNNIVKEAFSTMDVYLKKRWDLVPNLVEVVKGYATHEKDLLNETTILRSNNYENMSIGKKINVNEKLTLNISQIIATSENYPKLKASLNFLSLSRDLTRIEDEIANSRKYYNGSVRIFNTKIQVFPNNIVAKLFNFKEFNMFEANADEKNNVKVDL